MSKHKAPPLSDEILDEATTWFVEFLQGDVGQTAREAFIAWLKTSPEHIRAYLQVTAHWEDARVLAKATVPSIDELVALAREPTYAKVISLGTHTNEGLEEREPAKNLAHKNLAHEMSQSPTRTHRLRRFFIAASIAISMLGASAVYWLEFQRGMYSTDIGEQRSIRLGDGSTVELNARSRIRVALHEHQRDVELIEGQALFRVAKDHARPFIVHSGETNVLAVGTEFDVYKHHGETTVTVVEGRVAVFPSTPPTAQTPIIPAASRVLQGKAPKSNPQSPPVNSDAPAQGSAEVVGLPEREVVAEPKGGILLGAGEQLTVSGASMDKAAHADVVAATAWIQKEIVFNSTPLSEVVDEFNRYNTRQLVITDPRISDTRISGDFSSSNPDSLLKGLDALRKFKIRETPNRIEISGK